MINMNNSTAYRPRVRPGFLPALLLCAGLLTGRAAAQGCVAVRGTGLPLNTSLPDELTPPEGDWVASLSARELHSSRHFVGDVEQTQRQAAGNQVINNQVFLDLGAQYALSPQWSLQLTLPFTISDRSMLAPTNYNSFRYHTQAAGLGDLQLGPNFWIWNPKHNPKGNLQVGLALKAPTGENGATDTFLTKTGPVNHPVDQSIQPGDGGWGFTLEANAYRELFPKMAAYLQAFYLCNPQNQSDVLTWRDNSTTIPGVVTSTPKQAAYYEHFMSIPDQYFARTGLSYQAVPSWGLAATLGARMEGIPVRDLIGGSDGFRRPGMVVSIEPGLSLMKGRYSFDFSVPYAVYRARFQSVADERASATSGTWVHGDAAFADFMFVGTFAVRF
jgi:hypothetical protein